MQTLGIWEHRSLFAFVFMAVTDSWWSIMWGVIGVVCMVVSDRTGEP